MPDEYLYADCPWKDCKGRVPVEPEQQVGDKVRCPKCKRYCRIASMDPPVLTPKK